MAKKKKGGGGGGDGNSQQRTHQQQAEEVPAWADELLALKAIYEENFSFDEREHRQFRINISPPSTGSDDTVTSSTSPVAVMVIQYTPGYPKKPPGVKLDAEESQGVPAEMLSALERDLVRQAEELAATDGEVMVFNLAEALRERLAAAAVAVEEKEREEGVSLWDQMNRREARKSQAGEDGVGDGGQISGEEKNNNNGADGTPSNSEHLMTLTSSGERTKGGRGPDDEYDVGAFVGDEEYGDFLHEDDDW